VATDDQQVLVTGQADAPASFRVPGNGQIQPKAVYASFDGTSAVGDFLPALKIISDGGETVGVYPTETAVVAGASADVSWFPGVKPFAQQAAPLIKGRQIYFESEVGQSIPSGVVTALVFSTFLSAPGSVPPFGPLPGVSNPLTFVNFGDVLLNLVATWQAGNYDRYVEVNAPAPIEGVAVLNRKRGSLAPDDTIQVVEAQVSGSPTIPTVVTLNVFQASGANKTCDAKLVLYGLPYL